MKTVQDPGSPTSGVQSAAFQDGCAALTDQDDCDDAVTSVRLNGRYRQPDPGLKEHTMGQVIATGSNKRHRR
jgi:hypothetical protein